ncbi:transposase [Lyngbya sp. PCC 8106]|uniref:RNA-guided endonuclease InsQ/TnpB family protein n=1 Tax=Lyngbya sp. (strain PCC 8106) TaxID=313612 RepID=UPI0002EA1808|nr:transposase [Lyngbya sp. PCC 8106]
MNYQYRVYPSKNQEVRMISWLEMCRGVYNYALRERKDWIKSRKCDINCCSLESEYIIPADATYPGYYQQQNALTAIKNSLPHLKDVQSQVIQEPIRRVETAFVAMKQRGHGFPRFKKFGQYRSFLFPQFKTSPIKGNKIKLPKIGEIPIVLHRPIPDGFAVKTVRVTRKHSGWYITLCLQIDVNIPDVMPHGNAIGIDVGLSYFLSTSEGEQVARPRFFDKLQRQLKLLQRCLKRKQKRSNARAKLIQKIGRIHEQIAASRLDWQFKLAHHLCDQSKMIFVEDLDFRIMAKGMLGKHTLDAGLGQFINQVLPWVCFKRGVYYGKVDPSGTSQTCPDCGTRVKKDLSVRIHKCPECGCVKPRDVASGQVIKARGLSGVETASGWELSGCQGTGARQDRVKDEILKSDLGKPTLYCS